MSTGGWSYTVPVSAFDSGTFTPGGTSVICGYYTNYRFIEPSGDRRGLGLFNRGNQSSTCSAHPAVLTGSDLHVKASLTPTGAYAVDLKVADADGTTYTFAPSGTANLIEDRNGNQVSIQETGTGVFTETDTLGRTVLSSSGFGVTGNTLTVSGLAPYHLTWESVSYNFSTGWTLLQHGVHTCGSGDPRTGSLAAVKFIQLPNGNHMGSNTVLMIQITAILMG
jgi:hypothetical protein